MNSFDKKSSNTGTTPLFGRPPRVNASNNINGDELYKIHGAEGGFNCNMLEPEFLNYEKALFWI